MPLDNSELLEELLVIFDAVIAIGAVSCIGFSRQERCVCSRVHRRLPRCGDQGTSPTYRNWLWRAGSLSDIQELLHRSLAPFVKLLFVTRGAELNDAASDRVTGGSRVALRTHISVVAKSIVVGR